MRQDLTNLTKLGDALRKSEEGALQAIRVLLPDPNALLGSANVPPVTPPDLQVQWPKLPTFTPPVLEPYPTLEEFTRNIVPPEIRPLPEPPVYTPPTVQPPTDVQKVSAMLGALFAPQYAYAFLQAPYQAQQELAKEEEERRLRTFEAQMRTYTADLQRTVAMNDVEMERYRTAMTNAFNSFNALFNAIRSRNADAISLAQQQWSSDFAVAAEELRKLLTIKQVEWSRRDKFISDFFSNVIFRAYLADAPPEARAAILEHFGVILPPEAIDALGKAADVAAFRLQEESAKAALELQRGQLELVKAQKRKIEEESEREEKLLPYQIKHLISQIALNHAQAQAAKMSAYARSVGGAGGSLDVLKFQLGTIDDDIRRIDRMLRLEDASLKEAIFGPALGLQLKMPSDVARFIGSAGRILQTRRKLLLGSMDRDAAAREILSALEEMRTSYRQFAARAFRDKTGQSEDTRWFQYARLVFMIVPELRSQIEGGAPNLGSEFPGLEIGAPTVTDVPQAPEPVAPKPPVYTPSPPPVPAGKTQVPAPTPPVGSVGLAPAPPARPTTTTTEPKRSAGGPGFRGRGTTSGLYQPVTKPIVDPSWSLRYGRRSVQPAPAPAAEPAVAEPKRSAGGPGFRGRKTTSGLYQPVTKPIIDPSWSLRYGRRSRGRVEEEPMMPAAWDTDFLRIIYGSFADYLAPEGIFGILGLQDISAPSAAAPTPPPVKRRLVVPEAESRRPPRLRTTPETSGGSPWTGSWNRWQ